MRARPWPLCASDQPSVPFGLRLALGALLGGLTACSTPLGTLASPDGARRMVARDPVTGLTVVITTVSWDGDPADWSERVTILHALVHNAGAEPVTLAPTQISLTDGRGFRYDVLNIGGQFTATPESLSEP